MRFILEFIDKFLGGEKHTEVKDIEAEGLPPARCGFCGCYPCICTEDEMKLIHDPLPNDACKICGYNSSSMKYSYSFCEECKNTHPFFKTKTEDVCDLCDVRESRACKTCEGNKEKELDKEIDELTIFFDEISDEDFRKAVEEINERMKNKCYPDDCEGECQGMGWCDVAKDFRRTL